MYVGSDITAIELGEEKSRASKFKISRGDGVIQKFQIKTYKKQSR